MRISFFYTFGDSISLLIILNKLWLYSMYFSIFKWNFHEGLCFHFLNDIKSKPILLSKILEIESIKRTWSLNLADQKTTGKKRRNSMPKARGDKRKMLQVIVNDWQCSTNFFLFDKNLTVYFDCVNRCQLLHSILIIRSNFFVFCATTSRYITYGIQAFIS